MTPQPGAPRKIRFEWRNHVWLPDACLEALSLGHWVLLLQVASEFCVGLPIVFGSDIVHWVYYELVKKDPTSIDPISVCFQSIWI